MSPGNEIRLFIIIPIYGNWEDTLDCLGALESQSTTHFRVLLADDGSPSPPPAAVHAFEFSEYIRDEHRGFAANCNRAARVAIERGATHLLFLNSDTVFPFNFVEKWLLTLATVPDAILSPLVYWFREPSKIWFSGGNLTVWTPFFRLRRSYRETTEVDLVCGCALLAPAGAWRELGGFDEKYVTYFEDFDFTLRAKRRGIRTYVVPEPGLGVRHKVSGSFRGSGIWRRQYRLLTSSLIFIRSHYRGIDKWLCLGLQCAHLSVVILLNFPELPKPRLLWRAVVEGLSA